jgi:hypothetical protein
MPTGAGGRSLVSSIASKKVGLWHFADIDVGSEHAPCLGVKRTSLIRAIMSANDPQRTLVAEEVAAAVGLARRIGRELA